RTFLLGTARLIGMDLAQKKRHCLLSPWRQIPPRSFPLPDHGDAGNAVSAHHFTLRSPQKRSPYDPSGSPSHVVDICHRLTSLVGELQAGVMDLSKTGRRNKSP